MKNHIILISNNVIEYSFYLLALITPLIFTTVNYELFEFNKMLFVYAVTVVILTMLVIKSLTQGKPEIKKIPLLIPLLLFVGSQIFSTIFTLDRYTSLWGYYSRFHGGLVSTLSYLVLFYSFLTSFPKVKLKKLGIIAFSGVFLVSIYGFAEHFGIDAQYWVQDVKNRVFSTLGQPNWLAAYLIPFITLTLSLSISTGFISSFSRNQKKFLLPSTLYSILFLFLYVVLIFTGSRSGFIAIWLAFSLFCILYLFSENKKGYAIFSIIPLLLIIPSFILKTPFVFLIFWGANLIFLMLIYYGIKENIRAGFLIFLLFFLLLTFIIKTPFANLNTFTLFPSSYPIEEEIFPGPALDTGITESGDIRKIVWKGALEIAKHYPLTGSGVETFAYSYYQFRSSLHNLTSEWDFLYNKAHNEYLNLLATTGLLGFGTYLIFIFSVIFYFLKKLRDKTLFLPQKILITGLFSGWVSILITNFFGFSVVVVALLFFLLPAVIIKITTPSEILIISSPTFPKNENINGWQKVNLTLAIFLGLLLETGVVKMWLADYYFAQGYNFAKAEEVSSAHIAYRNALFLNSSVPFYHSEMAYIAAVMAVGNNIQKDKELTIKYTNEALKENNIALINSPNNVNYWKNSTKTYYELSQIDEKYLTDAITSLEKAQKLAPTDPKITYNLAVFYGKIGQNDKAITLLQKTIQLKPNYKDAHYAIALFYEETGKIDMAVKHLNVITTQIDPSDEEIKKKLKEMAK